MRNPRECQTCPPRPPASDRAALNHGCRPADVLAMSSLWPDARGVPADTDALSGVRNRRHFEVAVATETARFRRYGNPYAIVVVDLDGLRAVNEEHGHVAGDELIALTGVMLRACIRPSDTVARLEQGGAFGILAVECNREGASALTARVTEAFAAAGLVASLGVAIAKPTRDGAATLQAATDAMLSSRATLGALAAVPERFANEL